MRQAGCHLLPSIATIICIILHSGHTESDQRKFKDGLREIPPGGFIMFVVRVGRNRTGIRMAGLFASPFAHVLVSCFSSCFLPCHGLPNAVPIMPVLFLYPVLPLCSFAAAKSQIDII